MRDSMSPEIRRDPQSGPGPDAVESGDTEEKGLDVQGEWQMTAKDFVLRRSLLTYSVSVYVD